MTPLAGLSSSGSHETYLGWGRPKEGGPLLDLGRGRYRLSAVDQVLPTSRPRATRTDYAVKQAEVRQCLKKSPGDDPVPPLVNKIQYALHPVSLSMTL